MARSAADCGAILNAIAGADPADPTALQAPVPDHLYKLDGDLRGLRVGLDTAWASYGIDAPTQQALEACLAVLKDAGATVVPVKMPDTQAALAAWTPMCCAEVAATHAENYPSRAAEYGPGLKGLIEAGGATSGLDYARAHDVRQQFRGQMAALFRGVDVLLAPAFLGQNMTLERFASFGSQVDDWDNLLRYTAPFDVSGSPTLSLPAGFNADGAPFGFQLVADVLNEPLLVRARDPAHPFIRQSWKHRTWISCRATANSPPTTSPRAPSRSARHCSSGSWAAGSSASSAACCRR
jgi:amidase